VVRVAEHIGRGQDRELRHLVGDVLRRDVAHLEVAALQRHELGPLLEEVAPEIGLERKVRGDRLGELLRHLGPDVLVRKDGGEAQHRLVLRERRQRGKRHAGRDHGAAGEACNHLILPGAFIALPNGSVA
jgi:hypothetical protein